MWVFLIPNNNVNTKIPKKATKAIPCSIGRKKIILRKVIHKKIFLSLEINYYLPFLNTLSFILSGSYCRFDKLLYSPYHSTNFSIPSSMVVFGLNPKPFTKSSTYA